MEHICVDSCLSKFVIKVVIVEWPKTERMNIKFACSPRVPRCCYNRSKAAAEGFPLGRCRYFRHKFLVFVLSQQPNPDGCITRYKVCEQILGLFYGAPGQEGVACLPDSLSLFIYINANNIYHNLSATLDYC